MSSSSSQIFDEKGSHIAQNLHELILTLGTPVNLKTNQLRVAEKALLFLESLFTEQFQQTCQFWLKSYDHWSHLQIKARDMEQSALDHRAFVNRMNLLQKELDYFDDLNQEEYFQLYHLYQRTVQLEEQLKSDKNLSKRIEDYEIFLQLQPLHEDLPQLEDLYQHIQNAKCLSQFEKNLEDTKKSCQTLLEKLKETNQIIYLLSGLSVFILTIPLSFPFLVNAFLKKKALLEEKEELEERKQSQQILVESGLKGLKRFESISEELNLSHLDQFQDQLKKLKTLKEKIDQAPPQIQKQFEIYRDMVQAKPLFQKAQISVSQHFLKNLSEINEKLSQLFQIQKRYEHLLSCAQNFDHDPEKHQQIEQALEQLQLFLQLGNYEENSQILKQLILHSLQLPPCLQKTRRILSLLGKGLARPESESLDVLIQMIAFNNQLKLYLLNSQFKDEELTPHEQYQAV